MSATKISIREGAKRWLTLCADYQAEKINATTFDALYAVIAADAGYESKGAFYAAMLEARDAAPEGDEVFDEVRRSLNDVEGV